MSGCCATKVDFLLAKAKNFRDYISRYDPAPEVVCYMDSFREDLLIPTLLTFVVPIVSSNTTAEAVHDLMKKMSIPDDEKAEVASKLTRYLEMFVKVVTE